mmetsp:Transcript_12214/g.32528  ORF Transcript_12214/g.32528 Transcript_12214/m.32528 type:complete len:101 (-) Transcript_12214:223-525(-)
MDCPGSLRWIFRSGIVEISRTQSQNLNGHQPAVRGVLSSSSPGALAVPILNPLPVAKAALQYASSSTSVPEGNAAPPGSRAYEDPGVADTYRRSPAVRFM